MAYSDFTLKKVKADFDLKTNELLGEMTRYAVSYLQSRYSSAWLNHSTCPEVDVNGDQASTRQFVDRVLIPLRTD